MVRASFFLYLLALIASPLLFGTVETWSLTFMESTVFSAAVLYFMSRYRDRERPFREAPALLFILLLPFFFLLQLLPMPGAVVKFISPTAYDLYQSTSGLVSPDNWFSITMDKNATLGEFFRFSAYATIYFLTIQFTARRGRLQTTINLLVYTAAFIAILAIAQKVTADGLIYWFRAAPGNTVMGPYIYHNHFAGYMEMMFPLALCLFLWTRPAGSTQTSFRERFVDFFDKPGMNAHTLAGVSATVIATSVFFSLSRGGMISLCLSLLCLVIILSRKDLITRQGLFFILVPAVTFIFVTWFGWEQIIDRFLQIKKAGGIHNSRFLIWQDVLPMIRAFLLTGSGAGSFETVFPVFRTFSFGGRIIDHAHNDYLEILSTIGLVGTLLIAGFVYRLIRTTTILVARRHDPSAVFLWAASLTGMISIFLHSFTDFNFSNGANGLYFFTLCGLLISGATSRMQANGKSLLPTFSISRKQLLILVAAVSFLLLSGLFINIRAMKATALFNSLRDIALNDNIPKEKLLAMKIVADQIVKLEPLEARNFYLQGNIASFLQEDTGAAAAYRKAIELQPLKGEYLQQYAVFSGLIDSAFDPESIIQSAILVNPIDPEVHLRYGNWLLDQKEFSRGFQQLRTGLALDPKRLKNQLALLAVYGFKGGELQAILPDGIGYQLTLGHFLEQLGRLDEATVIYRHAEELTKTDDTLTAGHCLSLASYYNRQKMSEDALRITRRSVSLFSDDVRGWIFLGDLLSSSGLSAEAEESFRKAVTLTPAAIHPRLKLASFLAGNGRTAEAAVEYRQAVELMPRAKDLQPWHIKSIYNYYYREGDYDLALAVINKGIKALPGNSEIGGLLGDAYLQMGRKLEARLEYQQILAKNPKDSKIRQRLEKMGVSR